jgi:hypothetical protein
VIYQKGSGGLEIHIHSDTEPFNTVEGEIIDVDVTFKGEPDRTTYDLYIGCGGCADDDALVEASRVTNIRYETPVVEPFTQTAYTSIFEKDDKKFNTSALQIASCPEQHFTIRLVQHANASTITWGAVVGIKERFSFVELLAFPVYILRNHGDDWNDLWWTILVVVFVGAPFAIVLGKYAVALRGKKPKEGLTFDRRVMVREIAYEVAIYGFVIAMLENFIHLCYAQTGIPIGSGFWVGLIGVIAFANGLGIYIVLAFWNWATTWVWGFLEIAVGFGLLFVFGAGFYLGPAGLMISGLLRVSAACLRYEHSRLYY